MGTVLSIDAMFPETKASREKAKAAFSGLLFSGYNPLFSSLVRPGTADETGKKLLSMQSLEIKSRRRAQTLYDAWLAFYRGNTDRAAKAACYLFESIKDEETACAGAPESEGGIACIQKMGAAYLMCCLSCFGLKTESVNDAVLFIGRLKERNVYQSQAAEILLALYEMSVGNLTDIPKWLRDGRFGVSRVEDHLVFSENAVHPENLYIAVFATVEFAVRKGNFKDALAVLNRAEKVFGMHGLLVGDVYMNLYRTVIYEAIGFPKEAEKSIGTAVRMIEPDALWQIMAESCAMFEQHLFSRETDAVAQGVPENEEGKQPVFGRAKSIRQKRKEEQRYCPLTYRELEVLSFSVNQFSTEDIARRMGLQRAVVSNYKRTALHKLGVEIHADLVKEIRRCGVLPAGEYGKMKR